MNAPSSYLRGLNGLRAIAALSVVVSHLNMSFDQFGMEPMPTTDLAKFGVTIFFSLSGFLITYLLLKEKEEGQINIKKFYFRRMLRIWPLYFLVLGLTLITIHIFYSNVLPGSLFFYVFLLANVPFIAGNELPLIGHFWSLGVEEQFYIFWPWIIRNSKKTLLTVSIFTGCYFLLRVATRVIEYKTGFGLPYLSVHVTRFDCMAIGGIGAILFHKGHSSFISFASHKATQVIAWIILLLVLFNSFHIASVIDNEIISFVTVVLIINLSQNEKTLISLDHPVLNFIGKISYGIYMLHVLVIFYLAKASSYLNINSGLKYTVIYVCIFFLTVLIAWLSFTFFERTFLNLKDKYSAIKR